MFRLLNRISTGVTSLLLNQYNQIINLWEYSKSAPSTQNLFKKIKFASGMLPLRVLTLSQDRRESFVRTIITSWLKTFPSLFKIHWKFTNVLKRSESQWKDLQLSNAFEKPIKERKYYIVCSVDLNSPNLFLSLFFEIFEAEQRADMAF